MGPSATRNNPQNNPLKISDLRVVMQRPGVAEQLRDKRVLTTDPAGDLRNVETEEEMPVNEFDDWHQTEILVRHIQMTQPELIFSAAPGTGGNAVGDVLSHTTLHSEPLECAAAIGKRS